MAGQWEGRVRKSIERRPGLLLLGAALTAAPGALPGLWGVFNRAVTEQYALAPAGARAVFIATIGAFGLGAVFTGRAGDGFGPGPVARTGACLLFAGFIGAALCPGGQAAALCLLYGLPVGLGCACLYPVAMSCVQKWRPGEKGFATGVPGFSLGVTGIAFTYGGGALIARAGLRWAFALLGIALLTLTLPGALLLCDPAPGWKPPPKKKSKKGDGKKRRPILALFARRQTEKASGKAVFAKAGNAPVTGDSNPRKKPAPPAENLSPRAMAAALPYWLLLGATILATPSTQLFAPVIKELGTERGLTETAAALSLALSSAANGLGRFTLPYVSDRLGRPLTGALALAALAGASVVFAFARGYGVPACYGVVTFLYSGQNALLPAFSTDLFGQAHSGENYGLIALGMAIGAVLFPPIAAGYGDAMGPRHALAAGAALAAAACVAGAGLWQKNRQTRRSP